MPKSPRREPQRPGAYEFRPAGPSSRTPGAVILSLAEFDILKLVDYDGVEIGAAAEIAGLTRATCSRTLGSARRKITEALVAGKSIMIDGGAAIQRPRRYRCGTCSHVWTESEADDLENVRCPRCEGSRIIDLAEISGWDGGRFR